jgi:hypothetical protein
LRKAVKDVSADRWMDWFNGWVQEVFQRHGFFDPGGILLAMAVTCLGRTIRRMRARW